MVDTDPQAGKAGTTGVGTKGASEERELRRALAPHLQRGDDSDGATSITRNLAVTLTLTQALLHRQSLMMTNLLVIVIMKSTSKRP